MVMVLAARAGSAGLGSPKLARVGQLAIAQELMVRYTVATETRGSRSRTHAPLFHRGAYASEEDFDDEVALARH